VGQADGRAQICGAQWSAELRLVGTLVDDGDRDVGACVVSRSIDSCDAVVATTKRRCTSRGGARAAVARTGDAMLGFHRLRWKHNVVVLFHRLPRKHDAVVVAVTDGALASSLATTAAEAGVAFFSRARAIAGAAAGRPRAWREVLDATAFARPDSCGEARAWARRNIAYFRANYALAALVLVFVGLVYRPVSMLAFLALFVVWLGLYFGRGDGEPLLCLGRHGESRNSLTKHLFFR
jgi:hypothetical protein